MSTLEEKIFGKISKIINNNRKYSKIFENNRKYSKIIENIEKYQKIDIRSNSKMVFNDRSR
jgi:hypothetical protein